ncbi:ArgE/DapE family deacylase [Pendulispora brunnea]|uniref:ArgE/DapE family deacylase n=1 Tax=Pendulispora brunnea TaxID=2905690 RepID=A0ABZ2KAJ7_9BACT
MDLSALERRVVDAVDANELMADLEALVAIPSTGGSDAEHDVQAWCARRLAQLGANVDHWRMDLEELVARPDFPGQEVTRREAYGCVGRLGGSSGSSGSSGEGRPALVLCGHVDVVPPGNLDAWPDRDPWSLRVEGGAIAGRGTCDMKGGLAAIFGAVSALARAGVRLRRPLAVHAVVGEEDGGLGAFATLLRGHVGDACVIAEPTAGAIIPANAGSLTFQLDVPGQAAHGSTRTLGVSAIDKLSVLLAALRELEGHRNANPDPWLAHLDMPYPLSVGIVRAGDWASTVPDRALAEGRYGVRLGESVDAARREFEAVIARACAADPWLASHPARVQWPGGVFASGRLPEQHPLTAELSGTITALGGGAPAVLGAPYGSDLRLYIGAGVPTVQFGPGDIRYAHALDEHVSLAEMESAARAFALLALRRCGTE